MKSCGWCRCSSSRAQLRADGQLLQQPIQSVVHERLASQTVIVEESRQLAALSVRYSGVRWRNQKRRFGSDAPRQPQDPGFIAGIVL